jgi:hypothetical protein
MPEKKTKQRAAKAKREGKSPTTQAGEFVREEIHHVREGKHGARSAKQAIAIGLSKARRAGVDLGPPPDETAARTKRRGARRSGKRRTPSARRSRGAHHALEKEGRSAASRRSLAKQARSAARRRSKSDRSAAARKAARTKGAAKRSAAARKAARTRARNKAASGR